MTYEKNIASRRSGGAAWMVGIAVTLLLLGGGVSVHADVIHVPADYETIQEAIDAAFDGDEVVVAPGTYLEAIDFLGKAITLRSSDGADVTTIDGTGNLHVVQCVSSEGPDTVLDGFTITGGNADGEEFPDYVGGGMYNDASSPTVTNCSFIENRAASEGVGGRGGGMYNVGGSPTVTNCSFIGNIAACCTGDGCGGGMYNENSDVTVTNCSIEGNRSFRGGGMYNIGDSPTVTNCMFSENRSIEGGGGGMYNGGGHSNPMVTSCSFIGNYSQTSGGGMLNVGDNSPTVTNCLFIENRAHVHDGGGMGNVSGSSPTVTNCSFTGNIGDNGIGGMYNNSSNPTVTNCIMWGDDGEINNVNGAMVTVTYSNIQGGWKGTGNIDANPFFVDPAGGDFRLSAASPCIDAADNAAVPPGSADLDGNLRFIDDLSTIDTGNGHCPIVDMGAYEFQDGSEDCELAIVSSEPYAEAIDARQPSEPDGSDIAGWSEVLLTFNGDTSGLVPEDFTVTLDPPGTPPMIGSVFTEGNLATLQFGDFLPDYFPPGHWTIITYNASGSSVRLGYLPADVNNDKLSNANDVLFLIDVLNGVIDPIPPAYQTDTDRNGATNANDVLRVIDLLNGAGVYDVFNGASLPD